MKKNSFRNNILATGLVFFVVVLLGIFSFYKPQENSYPWHISQTNAYKLLNDYSGVGVTIAFLDTGLSEDLVDAFGDKIIKKYNVIEDNTNIIDTNGHGTEMVCVSSCSYEQEGIYGLAYKAKLMIVVVMDKDGKTSGNYISRGIMYAVENGADIINLSSGSRLENQEVKDAIEYAYDNNVIVVAAVGDYQEEGVLYPAKYDSVIAIQSQSKLGVKFKESSWGNEVDLLIPGELIQTLGFRSDKSKLEIVYESGSSISTAYFSSILALIIEKNQNYTVNDINTYIRTYEFQDDFIDLDRFIGGYQ